MRKPWLAALLVAGAAAVAWFLLRPNSPSEEPGRAAAEAGAAASLPERANALLTAPLPASKGSRTIRGRVLGPDGPVEGAIVVAATDGGEDVLSDLPCRCESHCGQKLMECNSDSAAVQLIELVLERRGEAPPIARASSGADGSFALSGLEEGSFALWAEKPGRLIGVRRGVSAGEEKADVEVNEGMTLRGKTVGDDDKPVSATVTAIYAKHSRFFDTVSSQKGTFSIGPLPPGEFSVIASAPGLLPTRGRASASEPDLKELKLFSPRRLAGMVMKDGNPARATVSLEGGHKKLKIETDAKGRFEFSGLGPTSYDLTAASGLAQASASVELKPGKNLLNVQLNLTRGGEIVGVVKAESGTPIADAKVSGYGAQFRGRCSQRTGPDGRFRLGPVEAGGYKLSVDAEGYFSPELRDVDVGEGETASADFSLEAASPLKGIVVDEEGHPVEGAMIAAAPPHPANEEPDDAQDAPRRARHDYGNGRTHADGTFAVDGLEPGQYQLAINHAEYCAAKSTATAPTIAVHITLKRGLEILGTLVDEDDKPVSGASVRVVPDRETEEPDELARQRPATEPTSPRGEFRVRGLVPGHYEVLATSNGTDSRQAFGKVDVRPGTSPTVQLKFEKGLSISGTVVDQAGAAVADVRVSAFFDYDVGKRPTTEEEIRYRSSYSVTGEDGKFECKQLKPGTYSINARGAVGRMEQPLKANAGDTDLKLVIVRRAKVRGRVLQSSGAPITHFMINSDELRDDGGAFEVRIRGTGEQRLLVQADGFATITQPYVAKPGEDVDVGDIVLGGGRAVSGKVLDAKTSDPIVNALVDVREPQPQAAPDLNLNTESGAVLSGSDGSFTLPHVAASPRLIVVTHEAHLPSVQPLSPDVSVMTLRMESGAWLVGTVFDASGKPIAQALIMSRTAQDLRRTSAGDDGHYRLGPLPRGPLAVGVYSQAGTSIPGRTIDIPESGEVQADFSEQAEGIDLTLVMPRDTAPMLVPADTPLPTKETDLYNLDLTGIHLSQAEEPYSFEAKRVLPGQYALLILQLLPDRSGVKVARQPMQVAPEPAQQKITVAQPAAFSEIKMTKAGIW